MEKIGLLTFHRTNNFGSALQTYGLYRKIMDLGFEAEVIDYRCESIEKREHLDAHVFSSNLKQTIKNIVYLPKIKKKAKSLEEFTQTHMNLSIPYDAKDICRINGAYHKIIVGSDIVWGRDITANDYNYFLEFLDDSGKKYAFSSSVGNYTPRGDEEHVAKLLKQFRKIAVREKDAVAWCESLGLKNVDWVCDPTMLLTKEEWDSVLIPKTYKGKYVLVYFFDDQLKCIADAISYAKKNKAKVYVVNYHRTIKGTSSARPTSLAEFVGLIKNADMIFTASYHGILFSAYYNKEFVFYTRAHSTRMISLAQRLGIEYNCCDKSAIDQYQPIDYKKVNETIKRFREESISILTQMLYE